MFEDRVLCTSGSHPFFKAYSQLATVLQCCATTENSFHQSNLLSARLSLALIKHNGLFLTGWPASFVCTIVLVCLLPFNWFLLQWISKTMLNAYIICV